MKRVGLCTVKCVIQQRSHFLRLYSVGSRNMSVENRWGGQVMAWKAKVQTKNSFGVIGVHGNMNRNES